MKFEIGDLVEDEDGCRGVVVIKYMDGDLVSIENDAAHPNPKRIGHCPECVHYKANFPEYKHCPECGRNLFF